MKLDGVINQLSSHLPTGGAHIVGGPWLVPRFLQDATRSQVTLCGSAMLPQPQEQPANFLELFPVT